MVISFPYSTQSTKNCCLEGKREIWLNLQHSILSQDGCYFAKSAYNIWALLCCPFHRHNLIWKTWALLQVKIFLWLAFQRRHWTRDRQARHDLKARERCFLCNQAQETIDHIIATCPIHPGALALSPTSPWPPTPLGISNDLYAGGGGHVLSTIVTNVRAWTPGSRWFLGKFGRSGTPDAPEERLLWWATYFRSSRPRPIVG